MTRTATTSARKHTQSTASKATDHHASAVSSVSAPAPRAGSKQALVIEMLSTKDGTSIAALMRATGWLPHTTRAALTGLRKRGFALERRRGGEHSIYRIASTRVTT